jgi:hypothetical protein
MARYWLGGLDSPKSEIKRSVEITRGEEDLKEDEGEKFLGATDWYLVVTCAWCGKDVEDLTRCDECGDLFCEDHIDKHPH